MLLCVTAPLTAPGVQLWSGRPPWLWQGSVNADTGSMTDGGAGECAVCLLAQPERKLTTSKATAENCFFMCLVLKICIGVYWAMLRAVPAPGLNCTVKPTNNNRRSDQQTQ